MRRLRWFIRRPSPHKQIEINRSAEPNPPASIMVCVAEQSAGIDVSVLSFDPPEKETVYPLFLRFVSRLEYAG